MDTSRTITASEFKATCLDLLDQMSTGQIARLTITGRGRPVAVVTASAEIEAIFGGMAGSVIAPPDFDFTAPAFDGVMEAAGGALPDHDV